MKIKTIMLTSLVLLLTIVFVFMLNHKSFTIDANDEIVINYKYFVELTFKEFVYDYDEITNTFSISQAEFTYNKIVITFDWYEDTEDLNYDYETDRFFYDIVNDCFVITDKDKKLLDIFY